MKGLNAESRGEVLRRHWEAIPGCVAVGIDAKRMDQHTQRPQLRYEHEVYIRHALPS